MSWALLRFIGHFNVGSTHLTICHEFVEQMSFKGRASDDCTTETLYLLRILE